MYAIVISLLLNYDNDTAMSVHCKCLGFRNRVFFQVRYPYSEIVYIIAVSNEYKQCFSSLFVEISVLKILSLISHILCSHLYSKQ